MNSQDDVVVGSPDLTAGFAGSLDAVAIAKRLLSESNKPRQTGIRFCDQRRCPFGQAVEL